MKDGTLESLDKIEVAPWIKKENKQTNKQLFQQRVDPKISGVCLVLYCLVVAKVNKMLYHPLPMTS